MDALKKLRKTVKDYDSTLDIQYDGNFHCWKIVRILHGTPTHFAYYLIDDDTKCPIPLSSIGVMWLKGLLQKRDTHRVNSKEEYNERFNINYRIAKAKQNMEQEAVLDREARMYEKLGTIPKHIRTEVRELMR